MQWVIRISILTFLHHTRPRMPLWRLRWRRWKWNTSKVKRYWSLISSRYMFSDAYVLSFCDVLAWFSTDLTKTGLIPRPSPPPAFDRLQSVYPGSGSQTLPRMSVLGFKEGSGNQTSLPSVYQMSHTWPNLPGLFPPYLHNQDWRWWRPGSEARLHSGYIALLLTSTHTYM